MLLQVCLFLVARVVFSTIKVPHLIYHLMNCLIPEGGVTFGNQIYAKMDCDRTARVVETGGGAGEGQSHPNIFLGEAKSPSSI